MQNTFMNTMQFLMEVTALFREGTPTSEELRLKLVPTGTINTASPGQFGPGGIYKYTYSLADGSSITVKCHVRQLNARGGMTCNSYRFPTAQLYVYSSGGTMQHVVWDNVLNEAKLIRAEDLWNDDQLIN